MPTTTEKKRAYNARYQKANLERIRISNAAWRAANREKTRKYAAKSRRLHPEKKRADNAKWAMANKDGKVRDYSLRAYGITGQEYDSILEKQGGLCAICRRRDSSDRSGRRLSVDHDHRTGKIRGLLCTPCNHGLGCFDDKIERLFMASAYLYLYGSTWITKEIKSQN